MTIFFYVVRYDCFNNFRLYNMVQDTPKKREFNVMVFFEVPMFLFPPSLIKSAMESRYQLKKMLSIIYFLPQICRNSWKEF